MLRYVWRDLVRNPRRTLASLVGVTLGVALFSGVLFFSDGSAATMTKRAIAPLALDMQRVVTSPLGRALNLLESFSGPSALDRGEQTRLMLTITNDGAAPFHEVVVQDEPPRPLTYVPGTTVLDGKPVADVNGQSPLAQGPAGLGLNLGTVPPGATVTLSYEVRAGSSVPNPGALRVLGKVSSREDVVPIPANAPPPLSLLELEAKMAQIPGVAAADGLSFVDLPPGSLRAGGSTITDPVRVFAFDRRYARHYPSIRIAAGSFKADSVLVSAEASRALAARPGSTIELSIPGRAPPLSVPVSGVTDLARAKPLFSSRKTSKLEDFLYLPNSVVVSPRTFSQTIIPAFRIAAATRGAALKSLPVLEVDVLVERSRLNSDPARAVAQTKRIARSIARIAPEQNYLIDNISNTLQVARDDAVVGKQMFLFLGLPAALLAAFLAAYAGSILASAQRREEAVLRIRGARPSHLLRMLAYRTLALAGAGAVLGTALGLVTALVVLGPDSVFEAAPGELVISAVIGGGVGMLATALALSLVGARSLRQEVNQQRREIMSSRVPAWRRLRLDLALLAVAAISEGVALRSGAFDAPTTSVSLGESVSLPSYLLLAPLVAWIAGILLSARVSHAVVARLAISNDSFGPVVSGVLRRSLRRRSWGIATGTVGIGLVVAFGASIAMFASTYDAAKADDARFTVGSDLRITPSVISSRARPSTYASKLRVQGISAVTPLVFKLENSVLIGPYDQNREDLAAIDPAGFQRLGTLSDDFFVDRSATAAMTALRADPRGVLVDVETAGDLVIGRGDRVQILLARGTKHQVLETFDVVGLFERFPGFPQGTNLVVNLDQYRAATGLGRVDFFLARASRNDHQGLVDAVGALRSGPGARDPLNIETSETTLNKDQSSLTALNVNGLVDLDSIYTLLMSAAAIGIFVFGLLMQRRREYVTMRAQGIETRQLRTLVLAEAGIVAGCGSVAAMLVGTGMAYFLVHVLRPLFILAPSLTVPIGELAALVALVGAATLVSALTATVMLRRLKPAELLREA